MTKTATFVRNVTQGAAINQAVYLLSESYTYQREGDLRCWCVLVSSVVAPDHGGEETFIFPSDGEGNVLDWGELPGSQRYTTSHAEVLRGLGYVAIGVDN